MFHVWLYLTCSIFLTGFCGANYCRDSNMCCQGRDSSCVIQKAHENAVVDDKTDKPCYCDHACIKLGDCCPDFRHTCGVQDCLVSNWEEWSECDNKCGSGSMVRTRVVLQKSTHGGRHCPTLKQRRACLEHSGCPKNSDVPLREETAMLLPGSLSASRHSNDTVDVRKNLRMRNPDDPESNIHKEYCVQYKVQKVTKACVNEPDYQTLINDGVVTVLCEGAALQRDLNWRCRGHGVAERVTRFYALVAPHCHGKWVRSVLPVTRDSEPCLYPNFIFV